MKRRSFLTALVGLLAAPTQWLRAKPPVYVDPGPLPGGAVSLYWSGKRIGWFDQRPGDVVTVDCPSVSHCHGTTYVVAGSPYIRRDAEVDYDLWAVPVHDQGERYVVIPRPTKKASTP